jgi:hypothetical protein
MKKEKKIKKLKQQLLQINGENENLKKAFESLMQTMKCPNIRIYRRSSI